MSFCSRKVLVFLLFFTSSVCAEVKLNIGEDVSLIVVNGEEVDSDSFFGSRNQVELENGSNQVLIQYSVEITSAGDTEIETSDTHVILFTAKDTSLDIKAPKIKSLSQLSQFNKGQQWLITDDKGKSIEFQSAVLKKEGFQLDRNYKRELEEFNATNNAAALKNITRINSKPFNMANATAETNVSVEGKSMPAVMLQYWFMQADKETQEEFKTWALTR